MALTLPPPPPNALLWVLTRVAATPCRRRSARNAASFAASALPRTLLPRLALPSHKNWVSFLTAVADVAINPILTIKLIDGDAVDFFQTGHAISYFLQTRATQVPNAVLGGLVVDIHGTAALHDDAADLLSDRHDLINA